MTRISLVRMQEEGTTLKDEWLEAFEQDFWPLYPRKACKSDARKAWLKIRPQEQKLLDELIAGLGRWRAYWESEGTETRFICHASRWLNGRRWEDELDG